MNKEDKFLNEIEEVLKSYKAEYEPGTWEDFAHDYRKKRSQIPWQRWTAAVAILTLLMYVAVEFFYPFVPVKNHKSVMSGKPTKHKSHSNNDRISESTKVAKSSRIEAIRLASFDNKKISSSERDIAIAKIDTNNLDREVDTSKSTTPSERNPSMKVYSKVSPLSKSSPDEELLEASESVNQKKNNRNVTYSFILSPSIGNEKLNLGSGFEVSYRLSRNVSISGGIMYSSLHGAKTVDEGPASKKLRNVELALSGFELPIGLRYHTNSGYFLTVGLSGMNVISQKIDYTYLSQVTETVTIVTGGVPQQFVRIVSRETTEESRQRSSNYIGFYTFSGGSRIKLGEKFVTLGPFIKVPFGLVSDENIKLIQGGVHLHLDF